MTMARGEERRWRGRILRWGAGACLAFVGVVGFAHTEGGRALLGYLPSPGGGCPRGYDVALSNEQRDRIDAGALAKLRGTTPVRSKRAFAFTLGETDRDAVARWSQAGGVACETVEAGRALRCRDIPAIALERSLAAESLLLRFDAEGRLAGVDASQRGR
ncbi:MAG: hypothetical protein KC636_26960, partial [Myxococcales bacterium]|nr:hypothetical protein [Myxococcales bacterium]